MVQSLDSAIGEALASPIVLLDVCSRVRYANRAADQSLDGRFGVKLKNGWLIVPDATLRARVAAAVGDLASGKDQWVAIAIAASGKAPGAVLHLARTTTESGAGSPGELLIIVVLSIVRALEGRELIRVRQHFGLSKTEAEVTALIVAGNTPREIAERRRSTEQTVRWHVKNIHAKTYTRRLTELVLQVQNVRSPF